MSRPANPLVAAPIAIVLGILVSIPMMALIFGGVAAVKKRIEQTKQTAPPLSQTEASAIASVTSDARLQTKKNGRKTAYETFVVRLNMAKTEEDAIDCAIREWVQAHPRYKVIAVVSARWSKGYNYTRTHEAYSIVILAEKYTWIR